VPHELQVEFGVGDFVWRCRRCWPVRYRRGVRDERSDAVQILAALRRDQAEWFEMERRQVGIVAYLKSLRRLGNPGS
jgi:hypothetical protein